MPIYEYICDNCKEKFSLLQKVSEGEKDTSCPHCSSGRVRKLISSFCCSAGTGGVSSGASSGGFSGGG